MTDYLIIGGGFVLLAVVVTAVWRSTIEKWQ